MSISGIRPHIAARRRPLQDLHLIMLQDSLYTGLKGAEADVQSRDLYFLHGTAGHVIIGRLPWNSGQGAVRVPGFRDIPAR